MSTRTSIAVKHGSYVRVELVSVTGLSSPLYLFYAPHMTRFTNGGAQVGQFVHYEPCTEYAKTFHVSGQDLHPLGHPAILGSVWRVYSYS